MEIDFQDRLIGRTRDFGPRNVGSNPAPGTRYNGGMISNRVGVVIIVLIGTLVGSFSCSKRAEADEKKSEDARSLVMVDFEQFDGVRMRVWSSREGLRCVSLTSVKFAGSDPRPELTCVLVK